MGRIIWALLFITAISNADGTSKINGGDIIHYLAPAETPKATVRYLQGLSQPGSITNDDQQEVFIERIINLGERVWSFIAANEPVFEAKYKFANALPKGVTKADELTSFSPIQYSSYRMYGKNLYGITVYDVTYTLVHRYGGQYKGQGQYLTDVTILPSQVDVLWAYTVNFDVTDVSVTNVGSDTRPVASLLMQLQFKVSTIIKKHQLNAVYEFRGDSAIPRGTELH